MARTHSTPARLLTDVTPRHPAGDILEMQGRALRKIRVLAEFMANGDDDGDLNLLADIILDVVEEAESSRSMALNTLRTSGV